MVVAEGELAFALRLYVMDPKLQQALFVEPGERYHCSIRSPSWSRAARHETEGVSGRLQAQAGLHPHDPHLMSRMLRASDISKTRGQNPPAVG